MVKNSIVKRWVLTVLLSIIVVTLAFAVFLCVIFRSNYYNAARLTLESRSSEVVLSYFNQTSLSSEEQFIKTARSFVENFSDKSVMEVWVIDSNGEVIVSSNGFSVKNEKYPDYSYAKADGKFGEWIGKNANGEKVMAQTYMLPESDTVNSAAVRYIVSLQDIDRQLAFIYVIVAFVAAFIILLVITSGAFFIRSIINPVKKINETAERIANGNFDVSIEKYKYNDEIGQLCETINHMAHEISESEQLKNEFISTVSHELRTPLTAIKGWGETIRSSDGDREITEKGINVIVKESERLTQLVEELLDFSRMENGKMSLKISRIDIVKELSDVIDAIQERAEREQIEIIRDISAGHIYINADGNRLKQVFVNIIDNSIKYGKKGGFVKISLRRLNNSVQIVFEDNGCGISKNDLPKIKQKFFKANNSARGSGIGLAVSDEIIALHNGELNFESVLGVGTAVTVNLPINV